MLPKIYRGLYHFYTYYARKSDFGASYGLAINARKDLIWLGLLVNSKLLSRVYTFAWVEIERSSKWVRKWEGTIGLRFCYHFSHFFNL